jgi:hypothetical protein
MGQYRRRIRRRGCLVPVVIAVGLLVGVGTALAWLW